MPEIGRIESENGCQPRRRDGKAHHATKMSLQMSHCRPFIRLEGQEYRRGKRRSQENCPGKAMSVVGRTEQKAAGRHVFAERHRMVGRQQWGVGIVVGKGIGGWGQAEAGSRFSLVSEKLGGPQACRETQGKACQ